MSAARCSPTTHGRYCSREIGAAGQAALARARVLIVGAGGLGSPVLQYLAGAGVGCLGIVDPDTLDASNLHRQPIYDLARAGEPKAALARAAVLRINPTVAGLKRMPCGWTRTMPWR